MFVINLTWQASTDDRAVAGYTVYRDGVIVGDVAATTFSDTGLQSAHAYSYTIRAYDAAKNYSGITPAISVTTLGDTTAPSAPAALTATPAQTSIGLAWTASTDNVGVIGYRVSRNGVVLGLTNATTYLDAPLTAGTTYTYAVVAVDAANNVSAPAMLTVATTPIPQSCTNNGTPYSITITVKSYTKNVGLGARGEVFLTVANGFAITQLQVKLGTQVVSEVLGAELRDVIGLGWTAPRTAGSYNLLVTAKDILGCQTTTTLARQVVVR
jgi:chitodextrinase